MSGPTSSLSHADAQRRRAIGLLLLSLVVAGGTAVAVGWMVAGYQSSVRDVLGATGDADVVVARQRLAPGTVVTADLVELRREEHVAGGMLQRVEDVVGKTVADVVLAGEPVRAERLAEGGAALSLDDLVPEGRRAVTILASRAGAVGGRVRPGSRVDVILTIRPEREATHAEWVADTLLQDVRVIGVGDRIGGVREEDPDEKVEERREVYVTLDVDPEQGEKLALADARGQLVLALRSPEDRGTTPSGTPVVTNAMLGLSAPKGAAAGRPAHEGTRTEIILGTKVKVEAFDEQGRHLGTERPDARP